MALYRELGISVEASREDIRAAYKRQALATHPDKGGCNERFHAVTRAFETLYDAGARARYDARLQRPAPPRAQEAQSAPAGAARGAEKRAGGAQQQPRGKAPRVEPRKGQPPPDRSRPPGAAHAAQAPAGETCDGLCEQLRVLLQLLGPAQRRRVLEEEFAQTERRALEAWMAARHRSGPPQQSSAAADALSRIDNSLSSEDESCDNAIAGALEDVPGYGSEDIADEHVEDAMHDHGSGCSGAAGRDEVDDDDDDDDAAAADDDDELEPEDGSEGEEAPDHRAEAPIAPQRFRCIGRSRGGGRYAVRTSMESINFLTKSVPDLGLALDFHVALVTIRQRLRESDCVELAIEPLVREVFQEHNLDVERDVGLSACVRLKAWFFLGRDLRTPSVEFARMSEVMDLWCRAVKPFMRRRCCGNMYQRMDPGAVAGMWQVLRQEYQRSWAAAGRDGQDICMRLDARVEARRGYHEQQLERVNLWRMRSEDRRQHWEAAAARRSTLLQRRREQQQLRRELLERRAMARADARSRRAERRQSREADRAGRLEQRVLRQIGRRLRRWRRDEARRARLRREAAAREALARSRVERARLEDVRERLRVLTRPGMTVAEMLTGGR